jgi:hypothetical protein
LRGRATLVYLLLAAALAGCGGGGADEASVDLEFTRQDGSVAAFPETVRAWCAPFDESTTDVEAVHVLAGERPQGEAAEPFWVVMAVRADVEREPTTTLPNDFVYTEPGGAAFFALDDAEHENNELSSADEESSGTIRVELDGCEPGDTLRLTFDQVSLGSELHQAPAMSVEGTVVATIGEPPAGG